jgi:hypothetical protein
MAVPASAAVGTARARAVQNSFFIVYSSWRAFVALHVLGTRPGVCDPDPVSVTLNRAARTAIPDGGRALLAALQARAF